MSTKDKPSYLPNFVNERSSMLNKEQIEKLMSYKPEDIKKSVLLDLFSNRLEKKETEDGTKYNVKPPFMYPTNEFMLPANTLPNQKETVLTTAGLYILNMHIITPAFNDLVPYVNYTLDSSKKDDLTNLAAKYLMKKKITMEQFKLYHNRLIRLVTCGNFLLEGLSEDFIVPNPVIEKVKRELFEKYKDEIDKNNATLYAEKIESKLLEIAKQELAKSPSYMMFQKGGKPSLDNHYKNMMITTGPLPDLVNGGFVINKNSYNEGVDIESYPASCNKLIFSSYNRGVRTQDGGTLTKYLYCLMQNVQAGPKGSDCGSELYREITLTKKKKKNYLYRYIYEGKKDSNGKKVYTYLDDDNIDNYIGKTIKLRSPMYCKMDDNRLCNICVGNIYYMLGVDNIGLTTTRASASIMYVAMKAMHNITVKVTEINIFDYVKKYE